MLHLWILPWGHATISVTNFFWLRNDSASLTLSGFLLLLAPLACAVRKRKPKGKGCGQQAEVAAVLERAGMKGVLASS